MASDSDFWFSYVSQSKSRSGAETKSEQRYNRRIAASKFTKIEVAGKDYKVDTINVSQNGMLVETEAPLKVGTKVIWGDQTTGRIKGIIVRVTPDGYGIVFRPGQSTALDVLKKLTDGLLAPRGDPQVRKQTIQKGMPRKKKPKTK